MTLKVLSKKTRLTNILQPASIAAGPVWAGEPVHSEQHRNDRDGRELKCCGQRRQWGRLAQGIITFILFSWLPSLLWERKSFEKETACKTWKKVGRVNISTDDNQTCFTLGAIRRGGSRWSFTRFEPQRSYKPSPY